MLHHTPVALAIGLAFGLTCGLASSAWAQGAEDAAAATDPTLKEVTVTATRGANVGGFVRLGYASVDTSWNTAVAAAGRSGAWQGLLLASVREGHETDNQGTNDALNASRPTRWTIRRPPCSAS